jgi:RNA polymerase sigma factor (sigma-70 family)
LQKLTKRERAVVVLRYWYDLTEQQIAEELGIAPGTVKSTAARALGKLKDDVTLTARAADFNPLVESEAAR